MCVCVCAQELCILFMYLMAHRGQQARKRGADTHARKGAQRQAQPQLRGGKRSALWRVREVVGEDGVAKGGQERAARVEGKLVGQHPSVAVKEPGQRAFPSAGPKDLLQAVKQEGREEQQKAAQKFVITTHAPGSDVAQNLRRLAAGREDVFGSVAMPPSQKRTKPN